MCNLYSINRDQAAIRDLFKVTRDKAGNLPPMPGSFLTTRQQWCAQPMANAS
jgi:hypothetical protein